MKERSFSREEIPQEDLSPDVNATTHLGRSEMPPPWGLTDDPQNPSVSPHGPIQGKFHRPPLVAGSRFPNSIGANKTGQANAGVFQMTDDPNNSRRHFKDFKAEKGEGLEGKEKARFEKKMTKVEGKMNKTDADGVEGWDQEDSESVLSGEIGKKMRGKEHKNAYGEFMKEKNAEQLGMINEVEGESSKEQREFGSEESVGKLKEQWEGSYRQLTILEQELEEVREKIGWLEGVEKATGGGTSDVKEKGKGQVGGQSGQAGGVGDSGQGGAEYLDTLATQIKESIAEIRVRMIDSDKVLEGADAKEKISEAVSKRVAETHDTSLEIQGVAETSASETDYVENEENLEKAKIGQEKLIQQIAAAHAIVTDTTALKRQFGMLRVKVLAKLKATYPELDTGLKKMEGKDMGDVMKAGSDQNKATKGLFDFAEQQFVKMPGVFVELKAGGADPVLIQQTMGKAALLAGKIKWLIGTIGLEGSGKNDKWEGRKEDSDPSKILSGKIQNGFNMSYHHWCAMTVGENFRQVAGIKNADGDPVNADTHASGFKVLGNQGNWGHENANKGMGDIAPGHSVSYGAKVGGKGKMMRKRNSIDILAEKMADPKKWEEGDFKPEPGDYLLVGGAGNYFRNNDQSHSAIIEHIDGTKIYTIEGNSMDGMRGDCYDLSIDKDRGKVIAINRYGVNNIQDKAKPKPGPASKSMGKQAEGGKGISTEGQKEQKKMTEEEATDLVNQIIGPLEIIVQRLQDHSAGKGFIKSDQKAKGDKVYDRQQWNP